MIDDRHGRTGRSTHVGRWAMMLATSSCAIVAAACSGNDVDEPPPAPTDDVIIAAVPPPPISGGTLIVSKDGMSAIAADPDRDMVWLTDLAARTLRVGVELEDGDEPGRVVEDDANRVHVLLRRGGAVVTIDLGTGAILERRAVCPAPRGIAVDSDGLLHVGCLDGQLVSLPADAGAPVRRLELDDDLRDVIALDDGRLLVSRFRAAEILVLAADGTVEARLLPSKLTTKDYFDPAGAWRMSLLPDGRLAVLHQRGKASLIKTENEGAYVAGSCVAGAVAHSTISLLEIPAAGEDPTPSPVGSYLPFTVLAVDFALAPQGDEFMVVSAATDSVAHFRFDLFETDNPCGISAQPWTPEGTTAQMQGQPTALAFDPAGQLVVQTREPARIFVLPGELSGQVQSTPIKLTDESRKDTGHEIFHRNPPSGFIACVTCHIEGGDDGRTWNLEPMGLRRTQNLRGGIVSTAPFHWDGTLADMPELIQDTFIHRMGGPTPSPEAMGALAHWIDSLPVPPATPPADADAVTRGRAAFENAKCTTCHDGEALTNNESKNVGTGGELELFQVPGLRGLRFRAPYMHTGCAKTIRDRFDPTCGGTDHGNVPETELDDLVAYLQSL